MADWRQILHRVDEVRWEVPVTYKEGMRVPARVYASEAVLDIVAQDQAIDQAANVACLPGLEGRSLAMPDIHWGYGFPIGGVAAMRLDDGVISPGGVGFDINCGTRLLVTALTEADVRPRLKQLLDQIVRDVPAGLGGKSRVPVALDDLDAIMRRGSAWMAEHGYGRPADLELTESHGCLPGADPSKVSMRARQRGHVQLGSLGSGNHFLEIQVLERIFDPTAASAFGLTGPGQVLVFLHTGSRGFGHQVCQDSLGVMEGAARRYGIQLPDRQLACAPLSSSEGRDYLGAMACAANFAWANRQCITELVRRAFVKVMGRSEDELGLDLLYDVAHNIAKIEQHRVNGRDVKLCVHRKGATRAFPAGHTDVPKQYRAVGQPVLVPGDMGRYSYVAIGLAAAMEETWGSACHGAGRVQSRHAAKRMLRGVDLVKRLEAKGIMVRCQNRAALAEEASEAYKDVAEVVGVLEQAGIARAVARMRPMGVVKG